MTKKTLKTKKFNWIIIALGVFVSSLLLQSSFNLLVPVVIFFATIFLCLNKGIKSASIGFLIIGFFILWTVAGWHLYSSTMITNFKPILFLRTKISNYYDGIYGSNSDTAIFFKLVLLNIKTYQANGIYKTLQNLSIIHLFVISGFHLNFLFWIFTFWCKSKKYKKILHYFVFAICLFYGLLLNLTFGVLRSVITLFLGKLLTQQKLRSEQKLTIAILFIVFLNPTAVNNIGFQLSCLGTLGVISGVNSKNKLLNNFFANVFVIFFVAPIIIAISHQFNLFSFILTFFFAPFFYVFIFYSWFFSWMSFLVPVSVFIVNLFIKCLFFIYSFKAMITIKTVNTWHLIIYYWLVLTVCVLINLEYRWKWRRQ